MLQFFSKRCVWDEILINSSGLSSQNEREIGTQQCLKAIFQLNEVATAIFDLFFFSFSPLWEYFKSALHLYFKSWRQSQIQAV